MQFYRKHKRLINITTLTSVASGIVWVTLEVQKTYKTLNSALDTSVIDFMEPPCHIKEESKDFVTLNWFQTYQNTTSTLNRMWNSLTFSYARRLLSLASSESKPVRWRALKQLAKINYLDNWHYTLLAHMCEAKVAVGLARNKDVDLRFFTEPPYRYNREILVNTVKEFLVDLHIRSRHVCIGYFISRVFVDVQDVGRFVDQDSALVELSKFIQSADDILTMCLESILHHSSVEKFARDIVHLNGLPLLMEIRNRFKDNVNVNLSLCKILSHLSVYPEFLEDIFRSGWIGVLAEWLKHSDIRISVTAAKTLANLDMDDEYKQTFAPSMFCLHPMLRDEKEKLVDVIFVHGLLGGVFYTWRQRNRSANTPLGLFESLSTGNEMMCSSPKELLQSSDENVRQYMADFEEQEKIEWDNIGKDFEIVWSDIPTHTNEEAEGPYSCSGETCAKSVMNNASTPTPCWPKDWLPEDCENLRVIGINYDTSISMWAPICPDEPVKTTIDKRSDEFLAQLVKIGVGKRPIIWVTHSMGGLIVKNILCKAQESGRHKIRKMFCNTKGVVFYSTPHRGSRIANIKQPIALVLWPSVEVQELREESQHLLEMHEKFLTLTKKSPMKVLSFVETKSTLVTALKLNYVFVEPHSANAGVGEYYEIPQDHLSICKPLNRHSFLYQKILHLIKEVVEDGKKKRECP